MNKFISGFLFLLLAISCAKNKNPNVLRPEVSHAKWDELLNVHVDTNGMVDYQSFKADEGALDDYLELIASNHPNENWNKNARKAYWINAYNAFTIKLVLDHYPVESIRDIKRGIPFINSVWDIEFISLQGLEYSLNDIEHKILRKNFDDPRIHFAINCASISCPRLHYRAFEASGLEEQLDLAAYDFINDPTKNMVEKDMAKLSKIFSWFRGDFKNSETPSIKDYINKYSEEKIDDSGSIDYLEYNWSLNNNTNVRM